MKRLLTFLTLFLMLGGVVSAEIITINCKLSEYVVFDANGIRKGRGLYRQTYTSKCESVKKKF